MAVNRRPLQLNKNNNRISTICGRSLPKVYDINTLVTFFNDSFRQLDVVVDDLRTPKVFVSLL